MPEGFAWYAAVAAAELEPGDLLSGCPLFRVSPAGFSQQTADVIVPSHSCDLANDIARAASS